MISDVLFQTQIYDTILSIYNLIFCWKLEFKTLEQDTNRKTVRDLVAPLSTLSRYFRIFSSLVSTRTPLNVAIFIVREYRAFLIGSFVTISYIEPAESVVYTLFSRRSPQCKSASAKLLTPSSWCTRDFGLPFPLFPRYFLPSRLDENASCSSARGNRKGNNAS